MNNVKDQLQQIVLLSVDFESAGYDNQPNTLERAANQLWNECAGHYRGAWAHRFMEALQGLPSYINMPFYNHDIEKLMYSIGYELDDSVDAYWRLCGEILNDAYIGDVVEV